MKKNEISAKRILLTGTTGFIGSCLLRRLVELGVKPHIIIRKNARLWRIKDLLPRVKCHVLDMTDAKAVNDAVKKVRPQIVYHLAANGAYSTQDDHDRIVATNIVGAWNLLSAAMAVKCELFVNTGSSSEYGFKTKPMKESDSLEPTSYYATTKCAMTLLCAQAARQGQIATVTLRPFAVYGPYEEPTRLVPTLMAAFFKGKAMDLVNSKSARDFIYIDDMIDAYLDLEALKKNSGKAFNIGTGKQSTIKDIVELAQKVTAKSIDLRWGAMPARSWDTSCWVGDVSLARKQLGWKAKVSLQEGLRKTWLWYEKNHDIYLRSGKLAS